MNIRATHRAGFRPGEWAVVEGIAWIGGPEIGRPCYRVRFIDGKTDTWPIYDPSDPYEFRPFAPPALPPADPALVGDMFGKP